jgi:hypothetical protein
MKGINNIKSWVLWYREGGGGVGVKLEIFLFGNAGFFVWFSVVAQWLAGSAVMVSFGKCYVEVDFQQLWWCLLAAGGWNTYIALFSWKVQVWKCCYCIVGCLFWMCGNKTSYVETPLSNTNIKSCVWLHFTDTCYPVNRTGMSRLKVWLPI